MIKTIPSAKEIKKISKNGFLYRFKWFFLARASFAIRAPSSEREEENFLTIFCKPR